MTAQELVKLHAKVIGFPLESYIRELILYARGGWREMKIDSKEEREASRLIEFYFCMLDDITGTRNH